MTLYCVRFHFVSGNIHVSCYETMTARAIALIAYGRYAKSFETWEEEN